MNEFWVGLLTVLVIFIYFLPTILAPSNTKAVTFIVNYLIGWTVIGWLWQLEFVLRKPSCH